MDHKRIITIQDISCLGQCSLTVALPIISACGVETCALPSAVLSTHTGGFSGFTFRDLAGDIPKIIEHWKQYSFEFDALYSGYLGSKEQVEYVKNLDKTFRKEGFLSIIDPAMADRGLLYHGFDGDHVNAMKTLISYSDYILPNYTEACFLTDTPYTPLPTNEQKMAVIQKIYDMGAKNVLLTGESFEDGKLGFILYDGKEFLSYGHDKIEGVRHGTGDIYASVFVGKILMGSSAYDSAKMAADFVVSCIQNTPGDHTYGVCFERVLKNLF